MIDMPQQRRTWCRPRLIAAFAALFIFTGGGAATAQDLRTTAGVQVAHDKAVDLARSGHLSEALEMLERLTRAAPTNIGVTWDYIVILTWAGREADAIKIFEGVKAAHPPDYVVAAVASAYRDLQRYPEALALYRQGRLQAPADPGFAAGEIRTLTDMDDTAAALAVAQRVLSERGDRVEVLLAASYAAQAARLPVDALRYADRALALAPASRDALRQRVLALDAMGAPDIALRLATANPGLLSGAELRRIEGSVAADQVRDGQIEPPSEAQRFAATDRAIATLDGLIAQWSKEGDAAADSVLRARFDRLIAWHDRLRMKEVVAEFEALRGAHVDIPAYVLPVAADAYLSLREPETAIALYRWALDINPKDRTARLGLSRALVETEEFSEALRQVDDVAAELPPWIYLKGQPEPIPNEEKLDVDMAAANLRLYADDLPEAERRFKAMADLAPNNATVLLGLAKIYDARGWPRLAREELQIAQAEAPTDFDVAAGVARNALGLQDWRRAEAGVDDLDRRFPENPDAQSLKHAMEVHNRWELQLSAERDLRASTSVAGGSGLVLGGQLYSPPLAEDWRVYGGYRIAHERVPEGQVTERLYDAGLEYRVPDITADAEARLASFGTERAGGALTGAWELDDRWALSGGGEILSNDTPLRALLHRITADAANIAVAYRDSESRDLKATAQAMPFSDGNIRSALSVHGGQRVATVPHFALNATFDLGASQNSRTDAPYFNPRRDALAAFGLDATQILYRRYEFTYSHRLVPTAGPYWEQGFGTGLAWGIRYEQRIKEEDAIEAAIGLGFSRQSYDGAYENSITITFNLNSRF